MNKKNMILAVIVIGVILFFYFNQHHHLSRMIESQGLAGIAAAIFMMMVMCLTPIPSEGLLLVIFNVYGVVMGSLYAWIGYQISTLLIFVVTRYISTNFIRAKIAGSRFETVDRWIGERNTVDLLIVRVLPIPAFIVNCVLGTIPSISFFKYWLTAAVAILPYYIWSSCLYYGFTDANYLILIVGLLLFGLMGCISYIMRKRNRDLKIK
ncbi:MAG TPA: VTT domain-containing protein [Bacillales bacterium]|nr:VTT domain-containing protein [Bacillales bacterium]